MNLLVFQTPMGEWCADCRDFPGTPPMGRGSNKYEAVGSLLFALQHEPVFWKYLKPEIKITEIKERGYFRGDTWKPGKETV